MHVIYTLIFGQQNALSSIYGSKYEYWFWKHFRDLSCSCI